MDTKARLDEDFFRPESLIERLWRAFVIRPVLMWQEVKCARAKAYLLKHDRSYRASYISNEVVLRRNELYDAGVSPDDPRIPTLGSVAEELPPLSWPHTNTFV